MTIKAALIPTVLGALVAFSGRPAHAESFSFLAPGFGQATITTDTNAVTVQLTDLVVNPTGDISNLSAFLFTLDVAPSNASLIGSSAQEVHIGGPDYELGPEVSPGWVLSLSGATTNLDVLSGPGHAGPAETIVGSPGTNGYTNANGSLTNGAHNPFLYETAIWTLTETGVTADTTVTDAIFQGGTQDGSNRIAGTLTNQFNGNQAAPAPEPSTIAMVACGAVLLGLSRLRRKS